MNYYQKRKLLMDWAYFRPMGPTDDMKENIEQMAAVDVARLIEIGDEMAQELSEQ